MKLKILTLLLIILLIYYNYYNIKANIVVFLTITRGILSPNCFWWNINDKYEDSSGILLYKELKKNRKIYPINILGNTYHFITDNNFIKQTLDNSPLIFGVGKLKFSFFKSFMEKNVGVSEGCPWMRRRKFNMQVLETNKLHSFSLYYHQNIKNILMKGIPKDFKTFGNIGKLITMKIVFGVDYIYEPIFEIFTEANSLKAISGPFNIKPLLIKKFRNFIINNLKNPKKNSLLYLTLNNNLELNELIDQVPHWIFPLVGIITVAIPRLLLLLANHPKKFNKIVEEINRYPSVLFNTQHFNKLEYTRKCILELFRLNNPVNSTFRTLLKDYNFNNNYKYKKGEQFLILNNPVLRDSKVFLFPNKFKPERWTKELENSYYAIMFNQGPQICPGKDLSIFILKSFIINFFNLSGLLEENILVSNNINKNNIPQMINPCNINIDILKK